jgi:small GTP-binding protein
MIGDASVGKTSILAQLVDHKFDPDQPTTIGANYQIHVTDVDNVKVELQIWDTAGQEKFRSLGPIYYRCAAGALIVYDVTKRITFTNIEPWVQEFQESAGCSPIVVIVGNKTDLDGHREVSTMEGKKFAEARRFLFAEISAKTGDGVRPVFDELTRAIVASRSASVARPKEPAVSHENGCVC